MKILLLIVGFVVASLIFGQSSDAIVSKYIDNNGGLSAIKSIQSLTLTGKLLIDEKGNSVRFRIKRPGFIYSEMKMLDTVAVQAFDGKEGWQLIPSVFGSATPEPMKQDELKVLIRKADIEGPLVEYSKKGYAVSLEGIDSVQAQAVYDIKLSGPDSIVEHYYIRTSDFRLVKQKSVHVFNGDEYLVDTYYEDYRMVSGYLFPYVWIHKIDDLTIATIHFDKIVANLPMPDQLFKRKD